jgi:hypothetical protein
MKAGALRESGNFNTVDRAFFLLVPCLSVLDQVDGAQNDMGEAEAKNAVTRRRVSLQQRRPRSGYCSAQDCRNQPFACAHE